MRQRRQSLRRPLSRDLPLTKIPLSTGEGLGVGERGRRPRVNASAEPPPPPLPCG